MQAEYWDSTIVLGDAPEEVARPATPRAQDAPDPSRRISREILLPQGRPGAWLLLLLALFAYVAVHALRSGLA